MNIDKSKAVIQTCFNDLTYRWGNQDLKYTLYRTDRTGAGPEYTVQMDPDQIEVDLPGLKPTIIAVMRFEIMRGIVGNIIAEAAKQSIGVN